jgi:hypothetical protein
VSLYKRQINKFILETTPKSVAVEWSALLIHILDVPDSVLRSEDGYPDEFFVQLCIGLFSFMPVMLFECLNHPRKIRCAFSCVRFSGLRRLI